MRQLFNNSSRISIRYVLATFLALMLSGFALRLFDLTDQPIDFHSTRQLRGAIIARGMYYEMLPSADSKLRQQAVAFWRSTGQYEPPILERIVAASYLIVGGEYIWIARLINSLYWLLGGAALCFLARQSQPRKDPLTSPQQTRFSWHDWVGPLAALSYYLFLPFGVQASRSFQPDPGMVMWLILFALAMYLWSEKPTWRMAAFAGAAGAMAVLTKAVAVFTVAGISIALTLQLIRFQRQGLAKVIRNPQLWSIVLLISAPTLISFLITGGDRVSEFFDSWTISLSHLLIEPGFYLRWAYLLQDLITPFALLVAIAGVLLAKRRNQALLIGAWAGYFIYGLFFPYQMYSHNYYHLQVVPLIGLSTVPVINWLIQAVSYWKPIWGLAFASAWLLVLVYFSWAATIPMRSQNYRGEPAYWQEIASYLPEDGKIIALTQDYGYRLMYYGWRKVILWPNRGEQKLSVLRGSAKEFSVYFARQTADKRYFLITAFRQFDDQPELKNHLLANFEILAQGNGYLIFDLSRQQVSRD